MTGELVIDQRIVLDNFIFVAENKILSSTMKIIKNKNGNFSTILRKCLSPIPHFLALTVFQSQCLCLEMRDNGSHNCTSYYEDGNNYLRLFYKQGVSVYF